MITSSQVNLALLSLALLYLSLALLFRVGGCLVGVLDEIKVISAPAKLVLGLGLILAIKPNPT